MFSLPLVISSTYYFLCILYLQLSDTNSDLLHFVAILLVLVIRSLFHTAPGAVVFDEVIDSDTCFIRSLSMKYLIVSLQFIYYIPSQDVHFTRP